MKRTRPCNSKVVISKHLNATQSPESASEGDLDSKHCNSNVMRFLYFIHNCQAKFPNPPRSPMIRIGAEDI